MILTKRQKEIFDYIEQSISDNGYAPTLEEIGERFKLRSLATVHKHVSNLEAKGLIRRKWNHSRAIEIVHRRRRARAVELPLLGRVAAVAYQSTGAARARHRPLPPDRVPYQFESCHMYTPDSLATYQRWPHLYKGPKPGDDGRVSG